MGTTTWGATTTEDHPPHCEPPLVEETKAGEGRQGHTTTRTHPLAVSRGVLYLFIY